MNVLVVVNDSPWGSTLSNTGLGLVRALQQAGHHLGGVFFQGDGVYHALDGGHRDPGARDLLAGWAQLARADGCELLLCSTACARRLPASAIASLAAPWRVAGLAELVDLACTSDRVLGF